jgi:hypothetical protein
MAAVSKTAIAARLSGVRIPPSPPSRHDGLPETLRFAQGPPIKRRGSRAGGVPAGTQPPPLGPPRGPGRAVRGLSGLLLFDFSHRRRTKFEKCPRHPAPALCAGAETLRFAQGPPYKRRGSRPGDVPAGTQPPPSARRRAGRAVRGLSGWALLGFRCRSGTEFEKCARHPDMPSRPIDLRGLWSQTWSHLSRSSCHLRSGAGSFAGG